MTITPPRRIAVGIHPHLPEAAILGRHVVDSLRQAGVEQVCSASLNDEALRQCVRQREIDLLIVLGGDGSMLRAGHLCAPLGVPVLGINLGHMGFLMEVQPAEWDDLLPALLSGSYRIEARMMLHATHCRGEQRLGTWEVLNEVVVCRGEFVRPITVSAAVDGSTLTTYIADGLIVATPTGSTAYALAVGGPILPPELRNILIVPIAPHLSVDRTIMLSEGAQVTITVHTGHEAVMSVDGQLPVKLVDGDTVEVESAQHTAHFVRFRDPSYFYRNLTRYMEKNPAAGTTND